MATQVKLILPKNKIEARDMVLKWETSGVAREWDEYFCRSLQVYSHGYESRAHHARCRDVLVFVDKVYVMAEYDKERREYLYLQSVPRGHKKRRMLYFKPAGYGTRGYIPPRRPATQDESAPKGEQVEAQA